MRSWYQIEERTQIPRFRLVRIDGKGVPGPWRGTKGMAWTAYKDMRRLEQEAKKKKGEG